MKILYLVLGSKKKPWTNIAKYGIDITWRTKLHNLDNLCYLYSTYGLGTSNSNRNDYLQTNQKFLSRTLTDPLEISSDSLTLPTYSGWDALLHKTISALRFFLLNSNYDYFLRTNVSSFWNPTATRNLINSNAEELESGIGGSLKSHQGIKYIEGDSIIISRHVAEKFVRYQNKLNYGVIDDVSLGDLCSKIGVNLIDFPRPRIERLWDFHDTRYGPFDQIYKFRCKVQHSYQNREIPNDCKIMKKLHSILLKSQNY